MSLGGLGTDVLHLIISHLLYHEPIIDRSYAQTRTGWLKGYRVTTWARRRHFGSCGQSCGCCRSHNPEDAGPGMNCQPCYTGWILCTVSKGVKVASTSYARRTFHGDRWGGLCTCDKCLPAWILRGWVCPMLWPSEGGALPAASLEWDSWTCGGSQ